VVTERLGGKGLTDDENRALTDYVAHGIPRLQSPPVDAELAQRGKAIFAIKCAGCHSGEKYTSGAPDPSDPLGGGLASGPNLFDVGTQTANLQILIPSLLTAMLPPPANELYQLIRGDRDLGASDKVQQVLGFRARPDRQAGRVKAPSLVNVWDNVLLFHNGQFQNLADAVRYLNDRLKLELGDADQRAVIEFLKTL
jgi:cytochrome c peroxidase